MEKFIIGIDLGGTNIKGAVFDMKFNMITESWKHTEVEKGPVYITNQIIGLTEEMLKALDAAENSVHCMGLGIPGLLDPYEGKSFFSPNLPGWEDFNIVNQLNSIFHFPVYIDNDVRVNLYGEWLLGAGKNLRNLVLITLGTGLGSGIVIDGRVIYGATSSAGEIGHMNMYREGRPCRCGSTGCLGRYVSAVGIVNTFVEKLNAGRKSIIEKWICSTSDISAKMISEAYDLNDILAIDVMHETGEILGFGLANVINLYNPELIIVGGGMASAGDRLLNTTRETIKNHSLKVSAQGCSVVQAQLGNAAGMTGAAVYAAYRVDSNDFLPGSRK